MQKNGITLLIIIVFLIACTNVPKNETKSTENLETIETSSRNKQNEITVTIINQDSETIGKAILKETDKGVNIALEAESLPPGEHGFHIHEKGLCEPEHHFESAGAHFNPFHKKHGILNPEGPHAGDLPNILVANDGTVVAQIQAPLVTLQTGTVHSLLRPGGTALIIHAKPDDYKTDPAGNAGERIACGVIKK